MHSATAGAAMARRSRLLQAGGFSSGHQQHEDARTALVADENPCAVTLLSLDSAKVLAQSPASVKYFSSVATSRSRPLSSDHLELEAHHLLAKLFSLCPPELADEMIEVVRSGREWKCVFDVPVGTLLGGEQPEQAASGSLPIDCPSMHQPSSSTPSRTVSRHASDTDNLEKMASVRSGKSFEKMPSARSGKSFEKMPSARSGKSFDKMPSGKSMGASVPGSPVAVTHVPMTALQLSSQLKHQHQHQHQDNGAVGVAVLERTESFSRGQTDKEKMAAGEAGVGWLGRGVVWNGLEVGWR